MRFISKNTFVAFFVIIVITFLFFIPDALGYIKSNPQHTYTGNSYLWDPWDVNVYVSAIKYSQINGLRYKNLFTISASENSVTIYPLYSLVGSIVRNVNPYLIYNLSTILFIPILLLSIFYFVRTISHSFKTALLTTTLASWAGGLGWLVYDLGINSADLATTPFMLLNVFQKPHASLALAFYVLALTFLYKFTNGGRTKNLILTCLFAFLSGYIYPYLLLSYSLIFLSWLVVTFLKEKNFSHLRNSVIGLFVLGLIGGAYSFYLLQAKDLSAVLSPILQKPGITSLFFGVGLFIIPLITNFKDLRKKPDVKFIYIWIATHFVLTLLPIGFARYFFLGIFIPLSYLCIIFFVNLSNETRKVVVPLFVALSFLSALFIQLNRIVSVQDSNSPYFWNSKDIQAIEFLTRDAHQNTISTYPFASFMPALSGKSVYFGHFYQTPNATQKENNLQNFFNNKLNTDQVKDFLNKNNIELVVWRNEKELWQNFPKLDRPSYPLLKQIFDNGEVSIWLVEK